MSASPAQTAARERDKVAEGHPLRLAASASAPACLPVASEVLAGRAGRCPLQLEVVLGIPRSRAIPGQFRRGRAACNSRFGACPGMRPGRFGAAPGSAPGRLHFPRQCQVARCPAIGPNGCGSRRWPVSRLWPGVAAELGPSCSPLAAPTYHSRGCPATADPSPTSALSGTANARPQSPSAGQENRPLRRLRSSVCRAAGRISLKYPHPPERLKELPTLGDRRELVAEAIAATLDYGNACWDLAVRWLRTIDVWVIPENGTVKVQVNLGAVAGQSRVPRDKRDPGPFLLT